MRRSRARLSGGPGVSDYVSMGVLGKVIPFPLVRQVVEASGRASQRQSA